MNVNLDNISLDFIEPLDEGDSLYHSVEFLGFLIAGKEFIFVTGVHFGFRKFHFILVFYIHMRTAAVPESEKGPTSLLGPISLSESLREAFDSSFCVCADIQN